MKYEQLPLYGEEYVSDSERMYVGVVKACDFTIKVGWTEDINARKRQHRRNGIDVIASWPATYDTEQGFHDEHRRDLNPSCGRRECYWPTKPVINELAHDLTNADRKGDLTIESPKRLWTLSDVELLLDTRAMLLDRWPQYRLNRDRNPDGR